ncbi:MAG TPA: hypothetical protein VGF92_18885 [Stellaceae bacterium]|jgi:hypothetical protein
MFIHVTQDFAVALQEPEDFKKFKLVIDAAGADAARLSAALDGVATLDAGGHAWVSEDWLRKHDRAAAWQDGLTAMIGVAKKYGWVDEQKKAIRAHIEWPNRAEGVR